MSIRGGGGSDLKPCVRLRRRTCRAGCSFDGLVEPGEAPLPALASPCTAAPGLASEAGPATTAGLRRINEERHQIRRRKRGHDATAGSVQVPVMGVGVFKCQVMPCSWSSSGPVGPPAALPSLSLESPEPLLSPPVPSTPLLAPPPVASSPPPPPPPAPPESPPLSAAPRVPSAIPRATALCWPLTSRRWSRRRRAAANTLSLGPNRTRSASRRRRCLALARARARARVLARASDAAA